MTGSFSKEDVVKAWSEHAGKVDQYDVRVVETEGGTKQTQLIDKETGSLSIAVNGDGAEALNKLGENAGVWKLDDGVNPKEAVSEENKVFTTSTGVLATPTQPEALEGEKPVVEIDNTGDSSPAENASQARAESVKKEK
jgi:hypothetical protein